MVYNMDSLKYEKYQNERFHIYERLCTGCGACCGAYDGDPCANLAHNASTGKYYCKDYENRIGPQKTLSGKIFTCVPIRVIAKHGWLRPNCAYNKVYSYTP